MGQHLRGKLGPAGRVELVRLIIEMGMSERQAAACLSVSNCTAHRWKRRWLSASAEEPSVERVGVGSLEPAASLAAPDAGRGRAAGLRGARAHGLGAAVDRRRDRRRALDGPRDPAPAWPVSVAAGRRERRSFATSGHARAICCTWTSSATRAFGARGTRSPATAAPCICSAPTRSATTTSTPSSTTTRGWSTASCWPTRKRPPWSPSSSAPWPGSPVTASSLGG